MTTNATAPPKKTKTIEAPPALSLATLAQRCGELHRSIKIAEPTLKSHYDEIFRLLKKARRDAGRGWLKWLADNRGTLGFGERQARRYLRESDVRTSDLEKEATRQKERRAKKKDEEADTAEEIEAESAKKIIPELRRQAGFLPGLRTATQEQIGQLMGVRDQIDAEIARLLLVAS